MEQRKQCCRVAVQLSLASVPIERQQIILQNTIPKKNIGIALQKQKEYKMNITDVKVFLRESNQLKAFVNIVIDDAFIIRNIKVIEGENGLFVAMPSRRVSSGEYRDIAHPINTETRNMVERIIIEKYKEVLQGALSAAEHTEEEKPEEKPEEKSEEKPEEKPEEKLEEKPEE